MLEYKVDIGKISPIKVGNKIPEDILDLPFRIVNDEFGRDSITLRQLTTDKTLVMDFGHLGVPLVLHQWKNGKSYK
ncbi:hypothetical protein KUH03_30900 [Sphingobacterium sp. E70]|uniref:hypothetical protein n=1 Tax=Sphingobacterium sp. E70 TaxID=2853439 RepID=UPI00211CA9F7|nr:hypothetical protein [Sphingobacterium sp. E70]ULT23546.1 hypothetical protein KUH03_30900 [Sphingobacterium sp. E70]